jgi:hypothetical protein
LMPSKTIHKIKSPQIKVILIAQPKITISTPVMKTQGVV